MSMTAEQTLVEDDLLDGDEEDDGFWHGAHLGCQWDADRVTLICGKTASWAENRLTPDNPPCLICHPTDHVAVCPICGTAVLN